jgi:hypothetical protein
LMLDMNVLWTTSRLHTWVGRMGQTTHSISAQTRASSHEFTGSQISDSMLEVIRMHPKNRAFETCASGVLSCLPNPQSDSVVHWVKPVERFAQQESQSLSWLGYIHHHCFQPWIPIILCRRTRRSVLAVTAVDGLELRGCSSTLSASP